MSNSGRVYLKDGQRISLCEKRDGRDVVVFRILKTIGRGASAVCYEAQRETDGKIGMLKEFYPADTSEGSYHHFYSMKRLEDGQLVPGKGTERRFDQLCDDYLDAYRLLNKVIADKTAGRVLRNFVQNSEIYYGCLQSNKLFDGFFSRLLKAAGSVEHDSYEHASVYIWSGWAEGLTFEDYVKEIRTNPQKDADFRLHDILKAMVSLTDGVKALHTAELLHLDIKPSNFMVAFDSDMHINSSNVSLFDVDTIFSVNSDLPKLAGSKGFQAPEILEGEADNRSDIYSIGAILFNAVVINDDIPDGLYNDSYYEDIDQLVKHSKLIKATEARTDVHLMKKIADILKKCLAVNQEKRYEAASILLDDLKDAELYSKQYAVSADRIGFDRRLKIVRLEKEQRDPTTVIQKMLYNHPLFENQNDGKELNVLVIGCGVYGQKFIDQCMQAGQMKDCRLSITAVSNTIDDDKDLYLRFRPDISRFVNIDGMCEKPQQAYASIRFVSLHDAAKGFKGDRLQFKNAKTESAAEDNREIVRNIINNQLKQKKQYHYIFISLGSDQLSRSIAKDFSAVLSEKGEMHRSPVVYVSEQIRPESRYARRDRIYPLCVKERITADTISPDLEQMAFNTHTVWNSTKKTNYMEQIREFRNSKDDYSSSLAFALSIRYKLHSIGIDTANIHEAARQFHDQILAKMDTDPQADAKFQTLTALEHRRWVLYMAGDGWTAPRNKQGELDLSECVRIGKARNNLKHTHACMVFSSEGMSLQSDEYTRDQRAKWNDLDIDPSLDELDRMSLQLHQSFVQQAEQLKKNDPLHNDDIKDILSLLSEKDENLIRSYERYVFCLTNILNGVTSYASQYKQFEKALIEASNSSKEMEESKRTALLDRLSLIRKSFIPAIEACFFNDYKKIDGELIARIPYILTWKPGISMAMGFSDGYESGGRNEDVFANVASATVIKPGRIRYYYCCTRKSDPDLLIHKLNGVLRYLEGRQIESEVSIAVVIDKNFHPKKKTGLRRTLTEMTERSGGCRLSSFDMYDYKTFEDASVLMLEDLKKENIVLYDGTVPIFRSAVRDGNHAEKLMKENIGYFEFDKAEGKFCLCRGCEYLNYIRNDSYIRISDMFSLMNVTRYESSQPEFAEDYEKLWDIYTGCYLDKFKFDNGISNWNQLCHLLSEYKKAVPPIAKFPLRVRGQVNFTVQSYYFPAFGFAALKKIVEWLREYKVVGAKSEVVIHTSDECMAVIETDAEIHELFEKLTERPYLFHPYYDIDPYIEKSPSVEWLVVRNKDLTVRNLNLDPENRQQTNRLMRLLDELYKNKFITDLKQDTNNPDLVSFVYSSPRIRKLLTKAGEILEIYTYFEVLKLGYFDDVSTAYQFEWEEGGVSNELDLVLTKGFRSIIAECKAVRELEMDYYNKLYSIANKFGIGNTCLLIGNTYRVIDQRLKDINEMSRSRGNQLSIDTISNEDAIINIAERLKEIMERQRQSAE